MLKAKQGSSLVEFVLLFPLIAALGTGLFWVALTGLRQAVLFHEAARLARTLSLSPLSSAAELKSLAEAKLAGRFTAPTDVSVQLENIPLTPVETPHQSPRRLQIIQLVLQQKTVTVSVQEPRLLTGALRE